MVLEYKADTAEQMRASRVEGKDAKVRQRQSTKFNASFMYIKAAARQSSLKVFHCRAIIQYACLLVAHEDERSFFWRAVGEVTRYNDD